MFKLNYKGPTVRQKSLHKKFDCDCGFGHVFVFTHDAAIQRTNDYKNVPTAFTCISVIIATTLKYDTSGDHLAFSGKRAYSGVADP
jgi:hypothetical protein